MWTVEVFALYTVSVHPRIFIMPSPTDTVGEGIMFSGYPCQSAAFVRSFVRTKLAIPWYLMNGLRNLDETYRKYLLAHTDNLIRFLKSEVNSKVKVAAGRRGGEDIQSTLGLHVVGNAPMMWSVDWSSILYLSWLTHPKKAISAS